MTGGVSAGEGVRGGMQHIRSSIGDIPPNHHYGVRVETLVGAAKRISKLISTENDAWGLVRCDGTLEELAAYRAGSEEYGWDVRAHCEVGDFLVGTVGHGRSRVIVNVNRVEGVHKRRVEWAPETDVPILPAVGWSEVAARYGRTSAWQRLDGRAAKSFVDALVAELQSATDVPEREGELRLGRCRKRSAKNRTRMLDRANGRCEGCDRNFRMGFGLRGDRALEVHHLKPLSQTGSNTSTRLTDLAVLCATCHRLVHADPQLRISGLRPGWSRMMTEE